MTAAVEAERLRIGSGATQRDTTPVTESTTRLRRAYMELRIATRRRRTSANPWGCTAYGVRCTGNAGCLTNASDKLGRGGVETTIDGGDMALSPSRPADAT